MFLLEAVNRVEAKRTAFFRTDIGGCSTAVPDKKYRTAKRYDAGALKSEI